MLWRISSWPRRRWRSWNLRVWWWRTVTPQQILKIKRRFLAPCHTFSIFFFQITERCPMKRTRFLAPTTYWSCALLSRRTTIVGVYRQAYSGIPLAVRFVGRDRLLWNSMVQGTQRFRQVRSASCVIPYVLCGCLYCLRCWCVLRAETVRPYISGGTGLHRKS